ncbi:hypothetical protein D3Y57_04200 (plasmid) [Sphingomonas paeninsulae]|uniref:Flagellar motor switch protein FliN-like C-terminal domain-containing protein n=1 Tax=Sphingomonas paeninsulae TaxID=2319844 RepID=A0A494TD97_SPHPE|nr:FliM/FliN family flagellar motor switch protein [Sphingomonas paeninsulae]AYJ85234.1 hypothetical protein D3Y57_04200 [Sphingomonas paeninsulae]
MNVSQHVNPLVKGDAEANRADAVMIRIASQMAISVARTMSDLCGDPITITAEPTGIIAFEEWRSDRSLWEASYQFGAKLAMVVAVNDGLADAMVERRFGGTSQTIERTPFRACRATAQLAGQFSDSVASAITQMFPSIGRAEILPAIAVQQFARASDRIATIALWVTSGAISGKIDIAFAPERVARLRDDGVAKVTSSWAIDLRDSVLAARLPVRVVLARPELSISTLSRLAVGDVVPIAKPALVPMLAGALRLATGTIDDRDGHVAIRIEHMESSI